MVTNRCPREEVGRIQPVVSETTFATFLPMPRNECGGTSPNMPDAAINDLRDRRLRFFWSYREGRQQNGLYTCSSIHYF